MPFDKDWESFYTTLSSVAGAIFALLFVALQVGYERWGDLRVRYVAAARGLAELGTPVIICLVALYPGHRWWLGGCFAACAGLVAIVAYLTAYLADRHVGKPLNWYDIGGAWIGTPFLGGVYALLLYAAVRHDDWGLHVTGWVCVWFVFSGVVQSWLLLVVGSPAEPSMPSGRHAKADVD